MSRPSRPFPPPEEGLRLHLLLGANDPLAPAAICQAYAEPVGAWLRARHPHDDPDLCQAAANEAIVGYLLRPHGYDPSRSPLDAYLRLAAERDLSNLRRAEQRHHQGRIPWKVVELEEERGNIPGRDAEPSRSLERNEEAAAWRALLDTVRAGLTPAEGRCLDLMLAGEQRTRAFAEALGLQGLSADEEAREVKRVKDRLQKRLRRAGGWHD
jgi:hypothetical protein